MPIENGNVVSMMRNKKHKKRIKMYKQIVIYQLIATVTNSIMIIDITLHQDKITIFNPKTILILASIMMIIFSILNYNVIKKLIMQYNIILTKCR